LKLIDVVRGINLDLLKAGEQRGMGIVYRARNGVSNMGGSHCTFKIFVNLLSSVLRSQTIFSFVSSVVVARLLKKGITCNEILSDCCNQQQRNQPVGIFFRHKQQKTIADT